MSLIAHVPSHFRLHARNPERSLDIGGKNTVFSPGYGAPFVRGLDNVRRNGTIEDFDNLAKLSYMLPAMHITGGVLCEPMNIPVAKRHLHMVRSLLQYSDKPFLGMVLARERAEDTMQMTRIAFGSEFVESHSVLLALCNGNSPLVWDEMMLDAMMVYAENNQGVLCTPFCLAGANTAPSVVGTVAQMNAEALAGVAFGQAVRRGSPMVYGGATMAVSMRSGSPMFSTPETWKMHLMLGQMARRYGIPFRTSGARTASKVLDIYAGYETVMPIF
jgi:trimethylamine--corrinoid protein Co-methyltransferase